MINFKRMIAVAKREAIELFRDKSRTIQNFIVPIFIMFLFASGLSADIKNIPFVILDLDNTKLSREYSNAFINSSYFLYRGNVYSTEEAEEKMRTAKANFYIEIPSGFARNVNAGKKVQIATFMDGTMPIRAMSVKGYISGTSSNFLVNKMIEEEGNIKNNSLYEIKSRYWYNQGSRSKYVFVPGAIAIILIAMPAIMMTLAIVKEKEVGTITNFYATPLTKLEFLLGKQFVYILIYFFDYFLLTTVTLYIYEIPLKGNFFLVTFFAFIYVMCTTGIGLLISTFAKSQISGVLIALIATMTPSFTFSGLFTPLSSLDKGAQFTAKLYPISFFMKIIIGSYTKNIPTMDLLPNCIYLLIFYAVVMSFCVFFLKKQE